jgi:hypothetical protein
MELKHNEIIFCNAKFRKDKEEIQLTEIVYKHTDGNYYNRRILEHYKVTIPVKLYDIEIISRLGFAHKETRYYEVKKSNEIRNKITGSYD